MKLTELVMLARVMSQRYGVSVCISCDGATAFCRREAGVKSGQSYFTIYLPLLKDKGKFDKMVRGYLDHEIGHVRYTNWNLWQSVFGRQSANDFLKGLWNIFEDVFIESRMYKAFPGSEINLKWLSRNLFTKDWEAERVRNITEMMKQNNDLCAIGSFITSYCLIKRRAMINLSLAGNYKLFDQLRDTFARTSNKAAAVLDKVDNVLAQPANSTEETLALAQEIEDAMRSVNWSSALQKMTSSSGDEQGDSQEAGDDDAHGNANAVFGTELTDVGELLSSMVDRGEGGAEVDQEEFCMHTKLTHALSELTELNVVEHCVVDDLPIPGFVFDEIALLRSGFMRAIPGLLQSVQYKPCKNGYSGRLSGRQLHKVGIGDGRIFQKKAERQEQRVDVALLLDASGSMYNAIISAQAILYAMLEMLKSLPKVRSCAAFFSSNMYVQVSKFSDKRVENYRLVKATGMTPTAGAVLKILPEFSTSKNVRRILFIITDGAPDSENALEQALAIAKAQDVEVYGIGLGNVESLLKKFFGDAVAHANSVRELPTQLAETMKKALVKAVAG